MRYSDDYNHIQDFTEPPATSVLRECASLAAIELEILDRRHGYLVRLWYGDHYITLQSRLLTANTAYALHLAKDKVYTYLVLSKAGIKVPHGDYFFVNEYFRRRNYSVGKSLDDAIAYAKDLAFRIGYPLIIKPAHLKQSLGVSKIFGESGLQAAILKAVQVPGHKEFMVIVQEYIPGPEYRLVFVKGKITLCYKKLVRTITGDGLHDIGQLLSHQQNNPLTQLQLDIIESAGFTPNTVLPNQQHIVMDDLSNIGVEPILIAEVNPSIINTGQRACTELGLNYAGIDIRCASINESTNDATIIEVNGNPWLVDYYYHSNEARSSVELTYKMLLQELFRSG
jgi:D-alanine-D-alanine ligase-like ATP-grasp enzyme